VRLLREERVGQEYYLNLSPSETQVVTLPESWRTLYYPRPDGRSAAIDITERTRHAFLHPAGIASFADAVGKAERVAIIVDDGTRPTPVADILGVVLAELERQGIAKAKTTIVVALGTHDPLSADDLRGRLGEAVAAGYEVIQHDARSGDSVAVGLPGEEGTVRINRSVVEADVRIGIGSVQPHPMAGFGGGPKLIMPGVAAFDSIVGHHMRLTVNPRSVYGRIEDNPFHRQCMAVAKAVGLEFSLLCVYDLQGQVADVLAGSLEQVFAQAVDASVGRMGLEFGEKVDVTITSAYPHTHGLQFTKGLSGAAAITKESGAILMAAPLVTPCPDAFFDVLRSIRAQSDGKPLSYAREIMSTGRLFAPDRSAEFNMAMYSLLNRPPIRTIVVSSLIAPEAADAMGLEHAGSLEEGLARLEDAYPAAKVAVFPSGGFVLPRARQAA
jgi:nickel-dependent lactate racemase